MRDFLRFFFWRLNQIPCRECGNDRFEVKITAIDGGCVSEFKEVCTGCGMTHNYWAYGSYEFPSTYSELASRKWNRAKYAMKRMWRKFYA